MKRIFFMSVASIIVLTGCTTQQNELFTAIENSYSLKTGTIASKFEYTTEYNNINIAGTVNGNINISFGDKYDKVDADVNFEDKSDKFEYYVKKNGDIVTDKEDDIIQYTALYTEAPNFTGYEDQVPQPVAATVNVGGVDTQVNQYTFNFDSLDTQVVKSLFDPIIKLGFISSNVLKEDNLEGSFTLNYYIEPTSGNLVKEDLAFTNTEDNSLATKTIITISNEYSYEPTEVELPLGYGEKTDDKQSEAQSEEQSQAQSEAESE